MDYLDLQGRLPTKTKVLVAGRYFLDIKCKHEKQKQSNLITPFICRFTVQNN